MTQETTKDSLGFSWHKHDRVLVDGDIIRIDFGKRGEPAKYCYGVVLGGSFGCDPEKIGAKIWVKHTSENLAYTIAHRLEPERRLPETSGGLWKEGDSDTWRRNWGIEYLVPEEGSMNAAKLLTSTLAEVKDGRVLLRRDP